MKRPVTVVTGFLGSGKTTLLAKLLSGPLMKNTAVLVNEFGEIGLDHHLLRRTEEKTVLLGGGCVCCQKREDLANSLLELLDLEDRGASPPLERVVIETTGLADPAPILFTVSTDPVLRHHFAVDKVIVTVDAVNGELHLRDNPESVKQIAAADEIVVTKTDIAGEGAVRLLHSRLSAMNSSARVRETVMGAVEFADLLAGAPDRFSGESPLPKAGYEVGHAAGMYSTSFTFEGAVDWTGFGIWLSMLLHARGEDVLRVKGLLDVGEAGPVVLNGVQHVIHPPEHLEKWPDKDYQSRIIAIARGITSEEILGSLEAFWKITGARPRTLAADVKV